jgi:DNA-directed RNA polymerase subunit RPC12/RpoP
MPSETKWICAKCSRALESEKVQVQYLGSVFTTDLLRCPGCGTVLVTEEIALGKMAKLEQVIEDK